MPTALCLFTGLFPPTSAVEGINSVPSVCLLLSALTGESFDLQTWNLAWGMTLVTARMSLKIKVATLKKVNFELFDGVTCVDCADPFCHVIWGHVMSQRDVMWRHSVTSWPHLMTLRQEYWQGWHVVGGCINTPAFSFALFWVHSTIVLNSTMSFISSVQDPQAQVCGSMVNLVNHHWHMICNHREKKTNKCIEVNLTYFIKTWIRYLVGKKRFTSEKIQTTLACL